MHGSHDRLADDVEKQPRRYVACDYSEFRTWDYKAAFHIFITDYS